MGIAFSYFIMAALFFYLALKTPDWTLTVVLLLVAALDILVGFKQIKKHLQQKK